MVKAIHDDIGDRPVGVRIATAFAVGQGTAENPYRTEGINAALLDGISVYVPPGIWSGADVNVIDGRHLTVAKGAIGLVISLPPNATCFITNWQDGLIQFYENGALKSEIDLINNTSTFVTGGGGPHATQHETGGADQLSLDLIPGSISDAGHGSRSAGLHAAHGNAEHTSTFEDQANKGAVSGYAPLGANQRVPQANLGSGSGGAGLKALFDDQTYKEVTGASGYEYLTIPFQSNPAYVWSNMPSAQTLFAGQSQYKAKMDLTGYEQARLFAAVQTAGVTAAILRVYYDGNTNQLAATGGQGDVSLQFAGIQDSGWFDIASGAKKADTALWLYGLNGDGAADPAFNMVYLVLRRAISGGGGGGGADEKAKVTSADTTTNYLDSKIVAGSNITKTILNPGGNEQLQISAAGAAADEKAKVSTNDTTTDFLYSKIAAGSGISKSILNPGGNEQIQIAATGGGGGGYYGVRAEDYISSGDGSPGNPYNASAIQSAVNALPSRGGIVFIKAGVWEGSVRIVVDTPEKHVIFQGEGTWWRQQYGKTTNRMRLGTHVIAGFDCWTPCDFYDMCISPVGLAKGAHGVRFIIDPNYMTNDYDWLAGMAFKRCKFLLCDTGFTVIGQNMTSTEQFQLWGLLMEQCGFVNCNRGMRIDKTDFDWYPTTSGGFRCVFRQLEARSCTGGEGFRFNIGSSKLVMEHMLLEGCGASGPGYAFYVNSYFDGGCSIQNINDGDGSNSDDFAYIYAGRAGYVRGLDYGGGNNLTEGVWIGGRGYFRVGRSAGTGQVTIGTGQEIILEGEPGLTLSVASPIDQPANVLILRAPTGTGYIGSTTPGGSPYTYTNLDSCIEEVMVVGGTYSDITRGGQSIGTPRSVILSPGDSIVITYTAAPTLRRFSIM